jgi:DNA-binding SARP family transcriptional activator
VVRALAAEDVSATNAALSKAATCGSLALLELAPLIVEALEWLGEVPAALSGSIQRYPLRWLPLMRRALETGNTRRGHLAATVLDEHGTIDDVGLLRAYAKTYSRRGPGKGLGKRLARRVSPTLQIRDLGQVDLRVGDRSTLVAQMRRKPASVLMYLVTRPGMAANREQVIDELWRDADPSGANNNLNQSLYFLRREIDPWYEDDVSVDYVHFSGDLVWLDPGLVKADSLQFADAARNRTLHPVPDLVELTTRYRAPFAPEFEYDEWAMSWRSRLHSTFLDLSNFTIERCVGDSDFETARAVAAHALDVDDQATDVEKRLIWLYHRLGLTSAARAQYAHLAAKERDDGFEPEALNALVRGPLPMTD